jgi:anti-sigma B factor antagonist
MVHEGDIDDPALQGVPGLRVPGEIDAATAPSLQQALEAAIAGSTGAFVLDLSPTEFMDSSGIGVLLRIRALLGREDRTLVVVCPWGPVRDVLVLCGLTDVFCLFTTPAAAAAALVRLR